MSSNASLDALLADALVSDYQRATPKETRPRLVLAMAALSGVGLAFLLGLAVRATSENANQNQLTRQALITRVQQADSRVSALEKQVQTAQRDYQAATQAQLSGTSLGQQAQERLARLQLAAGYTSVKGSGIELVVDDATADPNAPSGSSEPGKVMDRDLQLIVNGLWQSGASAISINDRRLTSTSAIRAAGEAILVNYRPLVPPYRIKAIGDDGGALAGRFRDGSAGLLLEELQTRYGVIWELQTSGQTTIPAAATDSNSTGGNQ